MTKYAPDGSITQIGYRPYPDWAGHLNNYARTNHGTFISPDGRTATLNSPEVVEALEFIVGWVDALGGIDLVQRFLSSAEVGAMDPFYQDSVGMQDHGDWILGSIALYNPDLNFGVDFLPTPTGENTAAWMGGWSWAVPRGARNPEEAFRVVEFLGSYEAAMAFAEGEAAFFAERDRPYVPTKGAHPASFKEIYERYLPDIVERAPHVAEALQHFVTVPERVGKLYWREKNVAPAELWLEQGRAVEAAIYGTLSPYDALTVGNERVQRQLDEFYR